MGVYLAGGSRAGGWSLQCGKFDQQQKSTTRILGTTPNLSGPAATQDDRTLNPCNAWRGKEEATIVLPAFMPTGERQDTLYDMEITLNIGPFLRLSASWVGGMNISTQGREDMGMAGFELGRRKR
jgi:hypothetical protein